MRGVASDIVSVCCVFLRGVECCNAFLLVVVVVAARSGGRREGKTCRVESLRVDLSAKAREWWWVNVEVHLDYNLNILQT
jgi:hypothetical protein